MVYHSVLQKDGVHYFALVLKSFFEVVEHPSGKGWVFIMEHMEMRALSKFQAGLGEQLARWDACCTRDNYVMLFWEPCPMLQLYYSLTRLMVYRV